MGISLKKQISYFLIISYLLSNFAFCDSMKGHIQQDDTNNSTYNKELFTGEVEIIDKKNSIELSVTQVLSSSYSYEGDEFFAEVSSDVETDKGIVIPQGTIVHGKIQEITNAKNMGRDGWVDIDFDYMVTPDGRQIPIQAHLSTKENLAKGVSKTVAQHAGFTLLGGVAGGLFALNTLGLGAAIASNGYTVAGGAAIGGVVGLTCAIIRKGNGFMINPGDKLKIKVSQGIEMPVFTRDAFKQEELFLDGLNVRINSVNLEKDPFGVENTIVLALGIDNYSQYSFSTFDIALATNTSQVYFPSPFGDTSLWFKTISPGDRVVGRLSFSVNDAKAKHWLVFYDRKTKKPVAKYSIENAKLDLKYAKSHKNKLNKT